MGLAAPFKIKDGGFCKLPNNHFKHVLKKTCIFTWLYYQTLFLKFASLGQQFHKKNHFARNFCKDMYDGVIRKLHAELQISIDE